MEVISQTNGDRYQNKKLVHNHFANTTQDQSSTYAIIKKKQKLKEKGRNYFENYNKTLGTCSYFFFASRLSNHSSPDQHCN